jgi:ferrochelatase
MAAVDRVGVLVMAYGSPASLDDIEPYYTHIRRGRAPTPEQVAELRSRYESIGGTAALARHTRAQHDAIAGAIEGQEPGRYATTLAFKHAAPFVEDGVEALVDAGARSIVGLVLTPHFSRSSVGDYHARAAAAATPLGVPYHGIESWHLEPAHLAFLTAAVRDARAGLPPDHKVVFTAHSLPERALVDDPYPDQLRASAAAVASALGLSPWADWAIGWQSAGRTQDAWRGPDITDIIRELEATGRCHGIVVCPQGFTSDHLEVLHDLDVVASGVAAEAGIAFARTRTVNEDPAVMEALAGCIRAAAVER